MKINLKTTKIVLILAALLLSPLHVDAQDPNQGIRPNIPPSPQAVAFNRLGDYQVNNNYGMPDISIPLYEIDFHGYKIPLTLHYEAAPLKPGYNYDVTGLGWTLSGNSCVSRTIKDIADECARTKPFTLDEFNLISGPEKEFLYYYKNNQLDQLNFQYDSYNIVLPSGRSIPFFMYKPHKNSAMTYKLMPLDQKIKICCSHESNTIRSFTITDENGIIYHFDLPEKANNIFQNDINADRNVTWLLTSIDIPSKGTIYYQYTEKDIPIHTSVIDEPTITVFRLFDCWGIWPSQKHFIVKKFSQSQSPRYDMRFLRHIIYDSTRIDFNYEDDQKHMKEIVVSDHGNPIRKFLLDLYGSTYIPNWQLKSLIISGKDDEGKEDSLRYGFSYCSIYPGDYTDYWGNRCTPGPSVNDEHGNSLNNRGLNDLGNFNIFFSHFDIGRDWTGIQEELSRNGILAQLVENKEGESGYYWKLKLQSTIEGDTRIPTSPEKHGVLRSIYYPNGGGTTFKWENHRFPTVTAADGDLVYDRRSQRIIEGGGFRIASITNWTADGTNYTDYYRYGFTLGDILHKNFLLPLPDFIKNNNYTINDTINNHIGCGEAVVDPNLFTFMSGFSYSQASVRGDYRSYPFPSEFRKMLVGQDSDFKNIAIGQVISGTPVWWEVSFSATKFRSLIGSKRPVVYPEITVYHEDPTLPNYCKEKTVYKYDIYSYQHDEHTNYLSSFNQTPKPDTAYFEHMLFDDTRSTLFQREFPAKRNQLKSRSNYSYNIDKGKWELVSEEKYDYNSYNLNINGFVLDGYMSRENYHPQNEDYFNNHPLKGIPLREFYKPNTQYFGRSELCQKTTTILRQGGNYTSDNTQSELFYYLYPGILRNRSYTDIYDKADVYSYIGQESSESYIGQNNKYADILAQAYDSLVSRNMLATITSAETIAELPEKSVGTGTKIYYKFYDKNILPFKLYESNGDEYEESLEVKSYGKHGNPTEIVDLKTGIHSVYLWDEDGRYMIAMIDNAELSQVEKIPLLLAASSWARHAMLQENFPNAQIQTWDYKPLIGVSSYTNVNGQTILYEYDGLGRLKSEKRMVKGETQSDTIHQYEYNYKN